MRRLWCVIFLIIAILIVPKHVFADIGSGTYEGLSWRLTDDGELILGNGGTQTMSTNYSRWQRWPWYTRGYQEKIKKVTTTGKIIVRGSMQSIFYGCKNVVEIDLSAFDTSQAVNMGNLFQLCSSLEKVDTTYLKTGNATDLGGMFSTCKKLKTIDVSGFDTSKCTNMWDMFAYCEAVEELDVTHFNTSNVASFKHMFRGCQSLKALDVSKWNTSKATTMTRMFDNCKQLKALDCTNWNVSKVEDFGAIFYNCTNLTDLDVSKWNVSSAWSLASIFNNCQKLKNQDLSSWNTSKVTTLNYAFANCRAWTEANMGQWDVSKVTDFQGCFMSCTHLENLDLSGWDTRSATTMHSMFKDCSGLETIDVSSFNTAKVTSMAGMFWRNSVLKELNLSNFDTSKVTVFTEIVNGESRGFVAECKKLETLDISSFNTSSVTKMDDFFKNTPALKSVNLGAGYKWQGNGSISTQDQPLLMTPTAKEYTGKWIREDEAAGPLTAEELRDTYSAHANEYAGVWVWEEKPNGTVIYQSPGSEYTGAMPNQTMFTSEDFVLAENNFHRPGYVFSHWKVLTVNGSDVSQDMTFIESIPANTFEAGDTVVLQAVLVPRNGDLALEDGTFDFTLTAGERIAFKDIPGGAKYQIWEETPDGWVLVNQTNTAGEIIPTETIESAFVNKYIPSMAVIQLRATKTIDDLAPEEGAFTFELFDENDSVIETVTNNAAGVVQFKALSFTAPGTYVYKIREVRGGNPGIYYDSHIETVNVDVVDHNGTLIATSSLGDAIPAFTNRTKPGTLKIRKTTDGKGTGNEEFTFEVYLTNELGQSLNAVDVYKETENGKE